MSIYAYFAGCDPLTSGKVQSADQLMAYIMVELFEKAPGIAGLLISAAFSASLSTVSSGVNALATITGQDIIRNIWPNLGDFKFTLILKCISILYGVICIAMAFLASTMESILPLTLTLVGILNGPILGVFCLGIYCPRCDSKGAVVGIICAVVLGFWLKIGAMVYPPFLEDPPLLLHQCPVFVENFTESIISDWSETAQATTNTIFETATEGMPVERPGIANLYALSYAYYSPLTCFTTIIVGNLFSLVTGGNDQNTVDPRLISPWSNVFCCCLPRRWKVVLDGEFKNQFSSTDKGDFEPVNLQMDRI
ncbi:Sodium-coupled monocarboxylate transporter 1 [Holothuria leucospilota]|uniref:Sodium-coupled monocarboxylate transporter 1 n=1 Tax=Holothuria leucospilota TaxID=206669 RepID=A0A9Q0YCB6_HOLLE|nr:Sodium-coupled monocarboxylate transporter 1 [Holothuria leucospilota]